MTPTLTAAIDTLIEAAKSQGRAEMHLNGALYNCVKKTFQARTALEAEIAALFATKSEAASSASRCRSCNRVLNLPDDPTTQDCGGDCLRCMANAGDPDCIAAMMKLTT